MTSGEFKPSSLFLVYNRDILTQLVLFDHFKEREDVVAISNLKELKPIIESRKVRMVLAEVSEIDFEFWKHLKSVLPKPRPALLALCSLTLPQWLLDELGFDDQLVKPFDLDELDQKISKHLG